MLLGPTRKYIRIQLFARISKTLVQKVGVLLHYKFNLDKLLLLIKDVNIKNNDTYYLMVKSYLFILFYNLTDNTALRVAVR